MSTAHPSFEEMRQKAAEMFNKELERLREEVEFLSNPDNMAPEFAVYGRLFIMDGHSTEEISYDTDKNCEVIKKYLLDKGADQKMLIALEKYKNDAYNAFNMSAWDEQLPKMNHKIEQEYEDYMGKLMDAAQLIIDSRTPSVSYLQRLLNLGYFEASHMLKELEKYGVVSSPNEETGERSVLINNLSEIKRLKNS